VLADLVELVGQMARLPWANGNVGMQGKSWSALNAIMTAMRRPPALKGLPYRRRRWPSGREHVR
jgi:predicted acyl esterase